MEDILAPTGFYDCLDVPSRGDGDAPTADQNNPTHADYVALPEDDKRLVNFRVKFLGGNKVTMRFTPSLEVFRLGKLLRPNVQIQMEMYLNDPSVWGIRYAGADTLRISAEEISVKLYIKQIKIDPAVYRTLTASFNGGKIASYVVVRGAVRTYTHPMDNRHFECNNPFNGQVPNRLVMQVRLLVSTLLPGVQTYNNTVDALARKYGVGDEDPLDRPPPKRKAKRKKKSSKKTVTKAEDLIKAATKLQNKTKEKFKLSRFVKKEKVKRASTKQSKSLGFDKRTTLLSLVRRFPDAKKPIAQWLKK